jgi:alpha-galactosidase
MKTTLFTRVLQFIQTDVSKVKSEQIPFYHSIFQSHQVVSNTNAIQQTFTNSGTTGMITSKHLVTDTHYMKRVIKRL